MGLSTGNGAGAGLQSEINITPLVDVVLVLLIIFMVIVPLTMRGYDVDIPGESTAGVVSDEPAPEQIVLAIDAATCPVFEPPGVSGLPEGCRVRVNDETVAVTALQARMTEVFADRKPADRVLFLTASEKLNYEGVMQIVDLARSGTEGLRIGFVAPASRS